MIRIETNVPIPKRQAIRKASRYPWEKMAVGDSFRVPKDIAITDFRNMAVRTGLRLQHKYSVRTDPKNPKGFRCWRVA